MLPESITAIVARNETWSGDAATEPYEAGWAREAVIFVRALDTPAGQQPEAEIQMSADGMHWLFEGTSILLPTEKDGVGMARVTHFGNWLRLAARFADGSSAKVLVTLHLKA